MQSACAVEVRKCGGDVTTMTNSSGNDSVKSYMEIMMEGGMSAKNNIPRAYYMNGAIGPMCRSCEIAHGYCRHMPHCPNAG